jgi:DNA gyrase/topoisomerase IV subunit A
VTANEQPADTIVAGCLAEYGAHALSSKLPHLLDGLKPVQRRILLTHHSDETPKAISIAGKVLDKYHPYNDAAISGAITRMAQPFNTTVTLMVSVSNIGDYGGGKAAAPRYLEIGASKFAQYVYFDTVDQSIFQMIPTESGNGLTEPRYMVPSLPMALIVANAGIAFGHSSDPANHCLGEVVELVLAYIKLKRKCYRGSLYAKLYPYLLPDFPIYQLIRNKQELLKSYSRGSFDRKIWLDGSLDVYPTKLVIRTLPYGVNPKDVWDKLGNALADSKPNAINTFFTRVEDYSSELLRCDIAVTLKRGVNVFTCLDSFKKFIGFTRTWTPRYLFTAADGDVHYVDPIRILEYWYGERSRCIQAELNVGQHKIIKQLRTTEALIKIGNRVKEVVDLLLNCETTETAIPILCERFGLSKTQAYAIMEYKLANIPKLNHAELVARCQELIQRLNTLQAKFLNVADTIEEDCVAVRKKFPEYKHRISNGPTFIGAVCVTGGIIQFNTMEELFTLVELFAGVNEIILYGPKTDFKAYLTQAGLVDESELDLPKEMAGELLYVGSKAPHYTVTLSATGKIGVVDRLQLISNPKLVVQYVADQLTVITKQGVVEVINTSSLPMVADANKTGESSDIIHIAAPVTGKVVVVYCIKPAEVKFGVVTVGEVIRLPTRSTVLTVVPHGHPVCCNIPDTCRNRVSVRYLALQDSTTIQDNQILDLTFNIPIKGWGCTKGIIHN